MKAKKKEGISEFFNKTKVKVILIIITVLFFLFVFFTSGSPIWLGRKILLSGFLITFSLLNLINMRLWIKILLSIIITPFLFLLLFGILFTGGMMMFMYSNTDGLDKFCKLNSDCVAVSEINVLYFECNESRGNCKDEKLMPIVNRFSERNKEEHPNGMVHFGYFKKPVQIVCENNKCKGIFE